MCGIAGIATFDGSSVSPESLAAMCDAMDHRGPDDQGYRFANGIGLGMRRLSIIDVAGGHQPIASEDGNVWAVLNGEIYNYRELRAELLIRGHRFSTHSDTETIVHLYEDEGVRCVERLRGMFALAVWDARAERLFVARDRLGIKPLYYTWNGHRLALASELKALLALGDVEREVDPAALQHLLAWMTTPRDHSIVAGVAKLEPAHWLVADRNGVRVSRYWDVRFAPDATVSEDEWIEALRGKLDEATRLHMVSDVPVGAFLSGGVDSSSVVAMMARQSSRPIKTFSVGFHEREYDELAWARTVARAFGTEHHEVIVTPEQLPSLEELVWHLDEPFGDSSAIPTWAVSKLASREVKVVLSGDGGDELFAGYDRYAVEARERRLDRVLAPLSPLVSRIAAALPERARGKNLLRHRALAGAARYLDGQSLFRREQRLRLLHPDITQAIDPDEPQRAASAWLGRAPHWLSSLQDFDLHGYLPLDILTKVDRMSMAHSLEARVPLLDHELVELAARIPPSLLFRHGTTKWLFKRALRGIVPAPILARRKQGFAVPLGHWFRGRLQELARDVLLSSRCRQRGLLANHEVERWLARPRRDPLDLGTWTLLSLELWCRAFLDRPAAVRRVVPDVPCARVLH